MHLQVLIPVFALGRAQELLLILVSVHQAMPVQMTVVPVGLFKFDATQFFRLLARAPSDPHFSRCVCMYVYMSMCVCMCVYVCMCVCMCACVYVCVCV